MVDYLNALLCLRGLLPPELFCVGEVHHSMSCMVLKEAVQEDKHAKFFFSLTEKYLRFQKLIF